MKNETTKLAAPVNIETDHFIGNADAPITLVEYGSYSCKHCHAAHEVVANLRDRFGDQMRYVFRHLPIAGSDTAQPAAVLAELAAASTGEFWPIHDRLMKQGPDFREGELDAIAADVGISRDDTALETAEAKVRSDRRSAIRSGARVTPSFFINGRLYEGAWDEQALSEAMIGSLGHRIHSATLDFVRWGPSTGLLLLIMTVAAVILVNSPLGAAFGSFWQTELSIGFGDSSFKLTALGWINDALLTLFFYVVGLEIKREFTIGHLAGWRLAALPIAASIGGMIVPALIYTMLIPAGPLAHGWGIPIATDTAFAIALIVLLGERVPVELRVFLTAAVIVDDLAAIGVVALFYSAEVHLIYIFAAAVIVAVLIMLNRWSVYRPLPYVVAGLFLWVFLHDAGIHATLAGVILAVFTPTRPPGNLPALLAQAENVLLDESSRRNEHILHHGPSEPAIKQLEVIFDRIESPASKILRALEPWSSYVVLPIFAFANAGVVISLSTFSGHGRLMLAIILGLAAGKPLGILAGAALAVRLKFAEKPASYTWRQVAGVGAMAGIGFTMSLFIAGQAFSDPADFDAAKVAVFAASVIAASIGTLILWNRPTEEELSEMPSLAPNANDGTHSAANCEVDLRE